MRMLGDEKISSGTFVVDRKIDQINANVRYYLLNPDISMYRV